MLGDVHISDTMDNLMLNKQDNIGDMILEELSSRQYLVVSYSHKITVTPSHVYKISVSIYIYTYQQNLSPSVCYKMN